MAFDAAIRAHLRKSAIKPQPGAAALHFRNDVFRTTVGGWVHSAFYPISGVFTYWVRPVFTV